MAWVSGEGAGVGVFGTHVYNPQMIEPFFLVVIDNDRREFSVEGPMTDDTLWIAAVCRAQNGGRQVNCHDTRSSRNDVVSHFGRSYKEVPSGSIVVLPV